MNQIVEKVEQITANGNHADQGSVIRDKSSREGSRKYGRVIRPTDPWCRQNWSFLVKDFKNNLAGEAQKEVLKENFYKEIIVQEEIRRRQKALDVADDRLKVQVMIYK